MTSGKQWPYLKNANGLNLFRFGPYLRKIFQFVVTMPLKFPALLKIMHPIHGQQAVMEHLPMKTPLTRRIRLAVKICPTEE